MDELIYLFLLQSGFPRAAVVDDLSLLPLSGLADGEELEPPSYAVVDPDTGDRLALIDVVGAVDREGLERAAARLGRYALRFGGRDVQGFVVRVDPSAGTPDAQVQFYRTWPDETLRRTSTRAFPDLESLRTWQLLARRRSASAPRPMSGSTSGSGPGPGVPEASYLPDDAAAFGDFRSDSRNAGSDPTDGHPSVTASEPGALAWWPGVALALLAVADRVVRELTGTALVDASGAVLLVGAGALLTAFALVRSRR